MHSWASSPYRSPLGEPGSQAAPGQKQSSLSVHGDRKQGQQGTSQLSQKVGQYNHLGGSVNENSLPQVHLSTACQNEEGLEQGRQTQMLHCYLYLPKDLLQKFGSLTTFLMFLKSINPPHSLLLATSVGTKMQSSRCSHCSFCPRAGLGTSLVLSLIHI